MPGSNNGKVLLELMFAVLLMTSALLPLVGEFVRTLMKHREAQNRELLAQDVILFVNEIRWLALQRAWQIEGQQYSLANLEYERVEIPKGLDEQIVVELISANSISTPLRLLRITHTRGIVRWAGWRSWPIH